MKLRSTMVTAGVSAAAALAATGITYASAGTASAPQEVPAAVAAPTGGDSGNSKGDEGKGNEGKGNEGRGYEGKGNDRGDDYGDEGRIQINERSYSTHAGDCITVVSGLGAKTLNIRNDSRKTVEVFRGAVCDNGAPIATVGRHSSSYGVRPGCVEGIDVDEGVVASFRVIKRQHDEY
ncbi:hypothetical protein [Streptomyces sp. SCL15-6]|uniref:hypothetical protein n=1 Tax=Streptomyces sp. SCL15-6 TaxID=2967222 RepID=UPI0029672385|nr:hypothetical protein [Streptomyces sp. SCL15-6]